MPRILISVPLLLTLLLCIGLEPVLANKFETIGGGVSGLSREKVQILKQISFYSGGFLLFLSVLALLARNRFEGFVGYSSRNKSGSALKGALVLGVFGGLLVGISYL